MLLSETGEGFSRMRGVPYKFLTQILNIKLCKEVDSGRERFYN